MRGFGARRVLDFLFQLFAASLLDFLARRLKTSCFWRTMAVNGVNIGKNIVGFCHQVRPGWAGRGGVFGRFKLSKTLRYLDAGCEHTTLPKGIPQVFLATHGLGSMRMVAHGRIQI